MVKKTLLIVLRGRLLSSYPRSAAVFYVIVCVASETVIRQFVRIAQLENNNNLDPMVNIYIYIYDFVFLKQGKSFRGIFNFEVRVC